MSATTETKRKESTNESAGFLGWIEKIGNKLPDPFWLFVILSGVVAVSSWLASRAGLSAVDPSSGEEIRVENLLKGENLSRMVSDAVENFIAFPPLGVILAVMLGVAIAEKTGLLSALVRRMVVRVSPKMLTFMVALAGVTGSVASDAIYVIIIPLGAMAFYAVGRSPIVGAMVAFAASSAGFNSSLILNITDLLLAGISTSAAQLVDEAYVVSPLANIFFVIPSAVVLSLIITAVTEFYVDKKAKQLIDDDHIDTSELAFDDEAKPDDADTSAASEGEAGASAASSSDSASDSASDSSDDSEGASQEDLALSLPWRRRACCGLDWPYWRSSPSTSPCCSCRARRSRVPTRASCSLRSSRPSPCRSPWRSSSAAWSTAWSSAP